MMLIPECSSAVSQYSKKLTQRVVSSHGLQATI
jgi:hypothetical protein